MKNKHIDIRIEQCLALAKASNCPRRKLAAVLIDPERNVILADGYNGGPRGAEGHLCRGHYCERDGLSHDDLEAVERVEHAYTKGQGSYPVAVVQVRVKENGGVLETFEKGTLDGFGGLEGADHSAMGKARAYIDELVENTPRIKSGTHMERGCHHAEMNVICNAAAGGVSCKGAWMIVLAEPCVMCAKMIHHSGIAKVILVDGGYVGGKAGVEYLLANGVEVQEVEGPQDPRTSVD